MRTVILLASARPVGDTRRLCELLRADHPYPLLDLSTYTIGQFDYQFANSQDDYLPLMQDLVHEYDRYLFATPVYWYSMSGLLKKFFDRFSDLLMTEKALGRRLRGKRMAVLACGHDERLDPAFWMPFRQTAAYLGMHYDGQVYGYLRSGAIPAEVRAAVLRFGQKLVAADQK